MRSHVSSHSLSLFWSCAHDDVAVMLPLDDFDFIDSRLLPLLVRSRASMRSSSLSLPSHSSRAIHVNCGQPVQLYHDTLYTRRPSLSTSERSSSFTSHTSLPLSSTPTGSLARGLRRFRCTDFFLLFFLFDRACDTLRASSSPSDVGDEEESSSDDEEDEGEDEEAEDEEDDEDGDDEEDDDRTTRFAGAEESESSAMESSSSTMGASCAPAARCRFSLPRLFLVLLSFLVLFLFALPLCAAACLRRALLLPVSSDACGMRGFLREATALSTPVTADWGRAVTRAAVEGVDAVGKRGLAECSASCRDDGGHGRAGAREDDGSGFDGRANGDDGRGGRRSDIRGGARHQRGARVGQCGRRQLQRRHGLSR